MSGFKAPEHTQVPNSFFDMMAEMSEVELRVTLCAIRKTFGWHKRQDAISLTQFQDMTGLSRQGVLNGIEESEKRGTIRKAGKGKRNTTIFELCVVEEEPEPKPDNVVSLDQSTQLTSTSQHSRPEPVNAVDTQKKENKEKESIGATPPTEPPTQPDDNFMLIRSQLDGLGLLTTITDIELFKSDFDEYTIEQWKEGIETFRERRKEKSEFLPYKYLASIVRGLSNEAKQAEAVKPKTTVVYTLTEPIKLPSVVSDYKVAN